MSTFDHLADAYIAAWNERDAGRRRDLIAQTWTEDARYLDPLVAGAGHDGIDAMIAGVLTQAEGHAFRRTGPVDAHHDRLRFGWDLVNLETGAPFMAGLDIGEVAADGRLRSIVGFLDLAPDLSDA
jgi:hypothetical protein